MNFFLVTQGKNKQKGRKKTRNKSYREAKMLLAVSKLNSKSIIMLELSIAQLII
jgi:hypothetical protein